MTVFDSPRGQIKKIAYGLIIDHRQPSPVDGGSLFRIERGQPYYRAGKPVYAVPQFRAVNIFSPTSQNSLLPTINVTPTRISYPVKVK